jgi:hypothetical protein
LEALSRARTTPSARKLPAATVSGGAENVASAGDANVSGGDANTASDVWTAVSARIGGAVPQTESTKDTNLTDRSVDTGVVRR